MQDLTKEHVAMLLDLQGYRIPVDELTEVTHRLNALMRRIREFDDLGVWDVEPVPVHPDLMRGRNHG